MLELARNTTATQTDHDDGVKSVDLFRRATFNWAMATKKMVESSLTLGNATVARAALADIEYAKEMLDKLFVPKMDKKHLALQGSEIDVTQQGVSASVAGVADRIRDLPCCDHGAANSRLQAHVDDVVGAPPIVRSGQVRVLREGQWRWEDPPTDWPAPPQSHRGVDLSAPVYSRGGKMQWAKVGCPVCPSKASQRCQKGDGTFIEKPHPQRKTS